jgi:hypothetical protein
MFIYAIPFVYNFIVTVAAYCIRKYNIAPPPKIYNTYYNATLSAISLYISVHVAAAWIRAGEIHAPVCIKTPPEIEFYKNLFYWLKYVEWYDTIQILFKNGGDKSKITNLHFFHHAIVPVMTHTGLGQPGDVYVILSNSIAHFLMYGYYALPSARFMKSYITFYQMIQHVGAFILASYHSISECNVAYPYTNILGYMFFLYEYLALLLSAAVSGGFLQNRGILRIECPVCIFSSLIYLTNAAHAYRVGRFIYGDSFLILTATSIIFRIYPRYVAIDYIAVANIMYQGGMIMWEKYEEQNKMTANIFIVIVLFLFVNYIHINHKLCGRNMSCHEINYRHMLFVHLASSVGLHLILT